LGIHSKIDGHELGEEKKSICKCASYLLWLGNEVMFYCVSNPCDSREEFNIDFNLARFEARDDLTHVNSRLS